MRTFCLKQGEWKIYSLTVFIDWKANLKRYLCDLSFNTLVLEGSESSFPYFSIYSNNFYIFPYMYKLGYDLSDPSFFSIYFSKSSKSSMAEERSINRMVGPPQWKNVDYLLSWLERFSSTLAGNRLSYLPPFQTNRIINEWIPPMYP